MNNFRTYCHYCDRKFTGQRSTAKYCSTSCRQMAKHARDNNRNVSNLIDTMEMQASIIKNIRNTYFNEQHNPETLLKLTDAIRNAQSELLKMDMYLATIEAHQANTWYQCIDCGQRTFGKVDTCDFCSGDKFRVVKSG